MILVESKTKEKELYYDYVSKGLDITYSESINYDSEALVIYKDEYMEFIEESVLFYYNSDNEDYEMIYSHDDFIDFIENSGFNTKKIKNSLYKKRNEGVIEFLSRLSKILDFELGVKLLDELRKELSNPIIYSHYYRKKKVNRIMTFHSSKGLESENVITVFQYSQYNIEYEYLRKCFVGFTRAKNHLYINFVDQAIGSENEKYINQLYQKVLTSVQK
jgi:ATP-dependent exoDNAse (exonuclease V) beta subunit